ncbi:MAG: thioredoxin domain-containing protein [Candidatus Woesearchaeota archaeon]
MLTEKKLRIWQITTVILAIVIIIGLFKLNDITGGVINGSISENEAEQITIDFINNYVVQSEKVSSTSVDDVSGLYQVQILYNGNNIPVYITKDGKFIDFGRGMINIDDFEAQSKTTGQQSTPQEIPKTDKPKVQLFVMSQCPYGVQAEQPMGDVLKLLKDKIDFELRFIATANSDGTFTSLHGEPEVNGDLIQVCVMKQNPDKYFDFILCQNKDNKNIDTNWEQCANSNGLDANKLKTCWQGNEGKQLLTENIKAAEENDVSGSPTLLINGVDYQGQRTSEAFKQGICSGFNSQPSECNQVLTTQTATASGNC